MRVLYQDIRYGLRLLLRSPAFTAAAVITLALGIGANTAIFTLVKAVLIEPLPFPEPDRLTLVWEGTLMFGLKDSPVAPGNYLDWRAQNRVFSEMGALQRTSFRLSGDGEPEQIRASVITASLLRTLGVKPLLGRSFLESEDRPGTAKVALLSYGLWQRRFGGEANAVGNTIPINGEQYRVVGVMPPSFRFPDQDNELWTPVGTYFSQREFSARGWHDLMVAARLKPGATLEQANQDIGAIMRRLQREFPRTNAKVGAFVAPIRDHFVSGVRRLVIVLMAAVGFVLLIACANVANLLLSRTADRRREIAVRAALGAGRLRITRQLLTENLLLTGSGAALGVLLSVWTYRLLAKLLPSGIAGMTSVSLDYRVLVFTLSLAVLTAAACGVAPAMEASRANMYGVLKQRSRRLQGALVVAEMALALVLLMGAGLMMQTFARLRGLDPGFRTHNVLTARIVMTSRYREAAERNAFYERVLARVKALPGVVSAGFTTGVPLAFKGWVTGFKIEGDSERRFNANYRVVTPEYLQTMGFPLRAGRYLEERDNASAPPVALVNETMARRFWPNQDPLGKRFRLEEHWITIVGMVGDVKQAGLDVPAKAEMYCPYQQRREYAPSLAIRTGGDPKALAAAVRREIRAVDKDLPITDIRTMEEILDTEVFQRRLQTTLLGTFAGLALVMASLGIYGVLAYAVTQRTHEIGLRMALGAQTADILRTVVGRGMTLAGLGVAIGGVAAMALTRVLASFLFGVSATDPLTFAGVSLLLLSVAFGASFVPARRAARVDPMTALRYE